MEQLISFAEFRCLNYDKQLEYLQTVFNTSEIYFNALAMSAKLSLDPKSNRNFANFEIIGLRINNIGVALNNNQIFKDYYGNIRFSFPVNENQLNKMFGKNEWEPNIFFSVCLNLRNGELKSPNNVFECKVLPTTIKPVFEDKDININIFYETYPFVCSESKYRIYSLAEFVEKIEGKSKYVKDLEQQKVILEKQTKNCENIILERESDLDAVIKNLELLNEVEPTHFLENFGKTNIDIRIKEKKSYAGQLVKQLQAKLESISQAITIAKNKFDEEQTTYQDIKKGLQDDIDNLSVKYATKKQEEEKKLEASLNAKKTELEALNGKIANLENAYETKKKEEEEKLEVIRIKKEELQKEKDKFEELSKFWSFGKEEVENQDEKPLIEDLGEQAKIIRAKIYYHPSSDTDREKYNFSKRLITNMLVGIHSKQLIMLAGAPGSGKSSFVAKFTAAVGAEAELFSVQANWMDRSDLLGYFNPMDESYHSTDFLDELLCLCKKVSDDEQRGKNKIYFICLDEMNLSYIEYYFADFLSALQTEKREIKLYNERLVVKNSNVYPARLYIPKNICFIGTINKDATTKNLSPKVVDRTFFIRMEGGFETLNAPGEDVNQEQVYLERIDKIVDDVTIDISNSETFISQPLTNRFKNAVKNVASALYECSDKDVLKDCITAGMILPRINRYSFVNNEKLNDLHSGLNVGDYYEDGVGLETKRVLDFMSKDLTEGDILTYWRE